MTGVQTCALPISSPAFPVPRLIEGGTAASPSKGWRAATRESPGPAGDRGRADVTPLVRMPYRARARMRSIAPVSSEPNTKASPAAPPPARKVVQYPCSSKRCPSPSAGTGPAPVAGLDVPPLPWACETELRNAKMTLKDTEDIRH